MADIVIIGGGVIGASTAFHLGARGAKDVVLLEKSTICGGETSKSGGFVQTHWDLLAEVRLIARSREMFANWNDRVGGDCGWVNGGYLHVTGTEREPDVRRVHDMLLADGLESIWLTPRELVELQPLLATDKLVGGAWEPSSGWADSVATTRSLAGGARARGVEVREGVQVTKIDHANGRITGVQTSAGPLSARVVVLAAGPYVHALHPLPEVTLPITIERGRCGYMDRPGGHPRKEIGFYDEVTGLYTHPAGDVNLVGCDRNMPFLPVTDPDDYPRDVEGKWVARAGMALGYRFPALKESRIVRTVAGLYDFSPDGQPIIDGAIGGLAGYYVATGFSGVGFKSAPATGLGLAELILDGRAHSVDLAHCAFDRSYAA